ncbi:MAG: lysine--tRNA ligase [Deltaproteobacteria bacterium]|jgi:lysyl-tRNA synthetase class 2|nr:lysine--tRNA ligase [Deltaproteobacteria bacterium]
MEKLDNNQQDPKGTENSDSKACPLPEEQSPVILARFQKAQAMAESGLNLYPNCFRPEHKASQIREELGSLEASELESKAYFRNLAGRLMARRDYGKSVFFDLQDSTGKIQLYARRDKLPPETYDLIQHLDIGDLVGVGGVVFKTKTGELSILLEKIELVTKSLLPLPEKFHEMSVESRYRRRYVDLIMNEESRRVFMIRTQTVAAVREFMVARGFLEVETPMMHVIPGGATAKPFETFHNSLDRTLYLRIAPELYLKRLLVGGFDRVFELNRNFRNEGLSIQHNPEFTMMEFYQSYADYNDLMDLTELMFIEVAQKVIGKTSLNYQGLAFDLKGPWARKTFHQSLVEIGHVPEDVLTSQAKALEYLANMGGQKAPGDPLGKILAKIFDLKVEPNLIEPTFITLYPADISPLARRNDLDPNLTDRFELFICGREIANAFSELNDPMDQRERFLRQVDERKAGDEEGMHYDDDYIRALMYGMPPAAGEGVGIDRLVMLLSDAASIRDVILFPHLRPEA